MSKLGDKYYGSHLGPHKTPYREEDPRPDIKLFYYSQEDYLKARHKSAGWTYSILRYTYGAFYFPFLPSFSSLERVLS